jgi:hypothetical protein
MAAGLALILVGSVLVLGVLTDFVDVPRILGAVAMFVMAAGALLVGISGESGRPV